MLGLRTVSCGRTTTLEVLLNLTLDGFRYGTWARDAQVGMKAVHLFAGVEDNASCNAEHSRREGLYSRGRAEVDKGRLGGDSCCTCGRCSSSLRAGVGELQERMQEARTQGGRW